MNLQKKLTKVTQQRPVVIVGAAFVDLVMNTPQLPKRGDDVFVDSSSVTVGGCALNIARIHKSLGLHSQAAIPVGQGLWAGCIRDTLSKEGITLTQKRTNGDNGWCIAMVEQDGERTFLSSSGVESQWAIEDLKQLNVAENAIVYLSGYQLVSSCGDLFLDWIECLPRSVEIIVDIGPRLVDLSEKQLQRLYDRSALLTLNRREAALLAGGQAEEKFCAELSSRIGQAVIYRIDKDGAFVFEGGAQHHVRPVQANLSDSIGAGDAHVAGLIYGLAMGLSVFEAAFIGNAVASHAVEQSGASLGISLTELEIRLKAN
ncbi:putative sugar kinase YdjH [Pseudovibrio sp. W64]|uniref:PfkB family carbohydrate kinase n=1 Tax=Pseudovibrio sp. W64 TaxID=1735583 RepID=UPI0007AE7AC2|nr:PfkB family carbohydrate kinase [Pseudovibrio sp. W64]KZK79009.1 putative sugar kinase YdjH [Pseudovibrio sp. W64]